MKATTVEDVLKHFATDAAKLADTARARVDAIRDAELEAETAQHRADAKQAEADHRERETTRWMTPEQLAHRAQTREQAKADENLSPTERSEVLRRRHDERQRAAFKSSTPHHADAGPSDDPEIARRNMIERQKRAFIGQELLAARRGGK